MSGQHCENYDVKRETVHCYPRNVDRCCTWSLESQRGLQNLLMFCFAIEQSLNDWSLGEQWICFPRISMFPSTSSQETLRFSGIQNSLFPSGTVIKVKCCMKNLTFSNLSQRHLACRNTSQHLSTGWPNGRKMLRPTMLRYVASKCCDRLVRTSDSLTDLLDFYREVQSEITSSSVQLMGCCHKQTECVSDGWEWRSDVVRK